MKYFFCNIQLLERSPLQKIKRKAANSASLPKVIEKLLFSRETVGRRFEM